MDESPPDGYSFLRSSSSNSSSSKGHNSTAPPGDAIVAAAPEGVGLHSPAMRQVGSSPNASSAEMGLAMGSAEAPAKRKRGRPRKYGDSKSTTLSLTTSSSTGRGSTKRQQLAALGAAGQDFTPHVIIIAAGEDVAAKIMAFSHVGPRAVCVISANGAISNATLRQPAMSGGTVTYEGRFEILSLSGSFLVNDTGGSRTRTGGLSVSLAGPDGRVVGGGVAGLLVAASQVQVVAGSFIADEPESSGTLDFFVGDLITQDFAGLRSGTSRTETSSLSVNDNGSGAASRQLGSQCLMHGNLHNWRDNHQFNRGSTDINLPLPGDSSQTPLLSK